MPFPPPVSVTPSQEFFVELLRLEGQLRSETILHSMRVLRNSENDIPCLLCTDLLKTLNYCVTADQFLQIIHGEPEHWVVAYYDSSKEREKVFLYDSINDYPIQSVVEQVASLIRKPSAHLKISMEWCPRQQICDNCGLIAIASMTKIAMEPQQFESRHWIWQEHRLSEHYYNCLKRN